MVRFVALWCNGKTCCVNFELRPVEIVRCSCCQAQDGVCGIQRAVLQREFQLVEVRNVPRRGIGVDVQRVIRNIRLVATVDGAIDRCPCSKAVLPVAKIDSVVRRCPRTRGKATVDSMQ